MIGFLIYELFELCYYMTKLGYNGISSVISWYNYNNNLTEEQIKNKIKELKIEIKKLEEISSKK